MFLIVFPASAALGIPTDSVVNNALQHASIEDITSGPNESVLVNRQIVV